MNTKELREKMNADFGKVFTCTFTKKDGSLRKMTGQLGVGDSSTPPTTSSYENYITVFDVEKRAFRNVNLETVTEYRTLG